MDFLTNLPLSVNKNDRLLVLTERVTRYHIFIPGAATFTAVEWGRAVFMKLVCRFGLPKLLYCDRDPIFMAKFWTTLFACWGVRHEASTAYHKTMNGLSEAAVKDVELVLSLLQAKLENMADWEDLIPPLELITNTATKSDLTMSPFKAIFGVNPRTAEMWENEPEETGEPSVDAFQKHLHDTYEMCKEASNEASELALEFVNKGRRTESFSIGDLAYLSTRHISKVHFPYNLTQLKQRYMGPFLVLDLDGTEQKIVKLDFATRPEHAKLHRYLHPWFVSHLLKKDLSQANPEVEVAIPTTVVNGTPSFEEKEEDVIDDRFWDMDEVLGERINTETGKKEYLISYVGFGPESNIWLPIQALNPEARKSVFLKFPKVTKIKAKKIVPEKKSISAEMASTTLPVRRSARHQPT